MQWLGRKVSYVRDDGKGDAADRSNATYAGARELPPAEAGSEKVKNGLFGTTEVVP